jgi:hypothetical protein
MIHRLVGFVAAVLICGAAQCDCSGAATSGDFMCYLNRFATGCR